MRLALRIIVSTALGLVVANFAAAQSFHANLTGSQEVPPNASAATGSASFTYDSGTQMLAYTLVFAGLSGPQTGAHIHGPASPGFNAGVIFPLSAGSPATGSVGPLTAQQLLDLNSELLYVNVHSTVFTGGETRGQILKGPLAVHPSTWGAIKELYRGT